MTEEKDLGLDLGGEFRRRDLIVKAGQGSFLLAAGGLLAACGVQSNSGGSSSGTIKIGFVSPVTGPDAGFGEGDSFVIGLVEEALKGGLEIGGKEYNVEIIQKDGESSPQRSGQVANELINSEEVDIMLTTSTPETTNPVADACEAAHVPCLATTVPWEAFYFGRGAEPGKPSPFKYTYVFCFGTEDFATSYLAMWNQLKTNKKVGALWPNDADGNAIRESLGPLLEKGGYAVVDPGAFPDGLNDFSSQISKFKAEDCQIINSFALPPDFATFWRQAAQQGFRPIIAQIAKTGLFPSQVEALGNLGPNLATAAYWTPTFPYKSIVTKQSSQELADAYTGKTGKQWNQQVGASMALLDGGIEMLKASPNPKDHEKTAKALSKLSYTSLCGPVNFKTGPVPNVSDTPIISAQWVKATSGEFPLDLIIVDNADDPRVPVAAKLKPY